MASHSSNSFKVIIFDLDNTLVDTKGADRQAYEKVKDVIMRDSPELDPSTVISAFKKRLVEAELDPDGIIPIDTWRTNLWIQALPACNQNEDLGTKLYSEWKSGRLHGIILSEDIRALLQSLRNSYKLLLMTNGDSLVQREKLNNCKGWQFFDEVIISGDYHFAKPDPAIFHHAFKLLNVKSEECVMIGDSLATDIQGAVNANVKSIWISDTLETLESAIPRPDYKLKSVLDLPEILVELNGK